MKISKKKIRKAARECEDVAVILNILFPKAFKNTGVNKELVMGTKVMIDGDKYMVCCPGGLKDGLKYLLVDINDGSRWGEMVTAAGEDPTLKELMHGDVEGYDVEIL